MEEQEEEKRIVKAVLIDVDAEGNTVSLSDEECEFVLAHVEKLGTRKYPDGYMMLTQCEG